MELVDLKNMSSDGKEYYTIILDLKTNEKFMVKNASCTAAIDDYLSQEYKLSRFDVDKRFKQFFNGNNPEVDLNNIYKKYHSYFK